MINQKTHYKWLNLLVMFYLVGWVTTYLMIYKMVEIKGILEPGAVFLFPLSYAVADIISEIYGYRIARQVVWFAFLSGFVFSLALKLVSMLPPPVFWHHQASYDTIFSPIMRAYFATTISSLAGNFSNIYIISRWKVLMCGKHFWLRSLISTGIGELIFSSIGGMTAYLGVEPLSKIPFLMLDGYLFKMCYALVAVFPATFFVYFLKKAENVDIFDRGINYNPFKISLH